MNNDDENPTNWVAKYTDKTNMVQCTQIVLLQKIKKLQINF